MHFHKFGDAEMLAAIRYYGCDQCQKRKKDVPLHKVEDVLRAAGSYAAAVPNYQVRVGNGLFFGWWPLWPHF